jgi:DNA-binding GntR family transcriptional regulator
MAASETSFAGKLEALSQQLERRAPVADQIANSIRGMIEAGDLKPGERIVESRVARQIGVGQPTVREALVALEHQGLVVRKANQGCVVTSLTRHEIGQLVRIRAELETLAVELAVEEAADDDIQKLIAITDEMKEAARNRETQRFFQLDLRFHETLWPLSGNSFLPKVLSQTLAPLLAFLFIRNLRRNLDIDMMVSAEAHAAIAEAILSRDKEAARRVTREKLEMFAEQHLAWYEKE